MSLPKALAIGKAADTISRQITRTNEVSTTRSAIATGVGAALGGVASGVLIVSSFATAPITVPLVAASALTGLIFSRF